MELNNRRQRCNQLHGQLTVGLFVALSILAKHCSANDTNQTKAEPSSDPSHLSWTSANSRFDFVFNIYGPIRGLVKLESDPENFLTNSLSQCTNQSACLFKDGKFLEAFHHANTTDTHKSQYTPTQSSTTIRRAAASTASNSSDECDTGNKFDIYHYCSTNWNPPIHLARINCNHNLEWHSPFTCHANSTNQERPCYIYEPSGKLIDLTHWILSNGTSYKVEIGNSSSSKVKQFNLNVCNEAHDACGPNVSACYIDDQLGTIESGYNNLTSIKYDAKDGSVLVTSLGHHKSQCEGSRLKTVIRFHCNNKIVSHTGPKLVRSTACESIIEWPTVYACPTSDVSAPAKECRVKYEPLGIDIDLKRLTNNKTMVEVPDVNVGGAQKKMLLGLCQAIPRSLECEGKSNSQTKACLIDARSNVTVNTATNSQIVGSISKSTIRLADVDRVYLESFAVNKTCSEPVRPDFNVTRKVGTRIEFFCSEARNDRPSFIGFDDCVYIFEWGTPELCPESLSSGPPATLEYPARTKSMIPAAVTATATARPPSTLTTTSAPTTKGQLADPADTESQFKKTFIKEAMKNVNHKVIKKGESPRAEIEMVESVSPPKMNSAHKFFMISLIFMSFAAFIVVIFVLDKKTRLRITLRQARQAFQTNNQQPYSRVVNDLDL